MTRSPDQPLPWTIVENSIGARYGIRVDTNKTPGSYRDVGDIYDEQDAKFIVEAVNAYDQNQQTIRDLTEALEGLVQTIGPGPADSPLGRAYAEAREALKLAKEDSNA